MPLKHITKDTIGDNLPAEGLLHQDQAALSECQRECVARLGTTIKLEEEAYLSRHPEIKALCEVFIEKMYQVKKKDVLSSSASFFTRPVNELDSDIREWMGLSPDEPYVKADKSIFEYKDLDLEYELQKIILKNYPPEPWTIPTPVISISDTVSSDFLSIVTSDTTLPTPEPILTPEPTLSETFLDMISKTVDKAIYSHLNEETLLYDTAYVELMNAVEQAMEVPVIEIKEDIAKLFFNAYKLFELDIMEKEKIAAEIAWEKRMRKKMKRTLRRLYNFKGYETPSSTKSEISSHESYKVPPLKPCECHPQFNYNRYAKDRFGIYLPREETYEDANVTVTPAISDSEQDEPAVNLNSSMRKKTVSAKNINKALGKKTTFK